MKIFYALTVLFTFFFAAPAAAQMSILFVDDSSDTFGNAELFASAIDSVGYSSTYYNATDSTAGPTSELMEGFDLVVWHTSTNGVGLKLWNGADEDNEELIDYLDGGGRMWLVGLDFFFDRYGAPEPTAFVAGDFAYDYLGIASYDEQSFGNDGGLGVPMVAADTNVIPGLPEITWQFPVLNWVDGVQLQQSGAPMYTMAGNNYPLAGAICGVYNDNRTSKVITYTFDMALVADFDLMMDASAPVLAFFENIVTSTRSNSILQQEFEVFPNPASGAFSLRIDLEEAATVEVSLLDNLGRVVVEPLAPRYLPSGNQYLADLSLAGLPAGMYFVRLTLAGKSGIKPLVIRK